MDNLSIERVNTIEQSAALIANELPFNVLKNVSTKVIKKKKGVV
jgi:hypothetical protein